MKTTKREEIHGLLGIFYILIIAACLGGIMKGQEPPKPASQNISGSPSPAAKVVTIPDAPKPSAYQPSAAQLEKLDVLQLRLSRAVAAINKANADLMDECKAIVTANKWPADTAWRLADPKDMLSPLVFEAPKAAEVKPEVRK